MCMIYVQCLPKVLAKMCALFLPEMHRYFNRERIFGTSGGPERHIQILGIGKISDI